jgi:23S rRNA pseudouridine2457 synthase
MPRTALPIHSPYKKFNYIAVYKPYGMLSQFTDNEGRKTLSDIAKFPNNVYSVGRLDSDSEGLLLLTNDKKLTDFLLNPRYAHEREYYVQVEGVPAMEDLEKLLTGIKIGGEKTLPAKAKIIKEPSFTSRIPPIRERKNIPTAWISLTLKEGKNRQVRKMTAHIGFPTLRLVRVRIKNIKLSKLLPGNFRELTEDEVSNLKK